jgi:hypothetical protein
MPYGLIFGLQATKQPIRKAIKTEAAKYFFRIGVVCNNLRNTNEKALSEFSSPCFGMLHPKISAIV